MPTSVLLAVLAAAGLLALAPALTRRYDATERVAAERATSTARVLTRRRRRRTVPGRHPINPPRSLAPAPSRILDGLGRRGTTNHPRSRSRLPSALHRRRRVFLALVLLNLVELAGVALVGPGFWIGFSVSFAVLLADIAYLRRRALSAARRRRARRARIRWVAAQHAAVRREHARRAAERQAAIRRVAGSDYVERYTSRHDREVGTSGAS